MHRRSAAFLYLILLLMAVSIPVSAADPDASLSNNTEENDELCQHLWDDGIVLREATCIRAGLLQRTCTLCNAQQEETIPKLNHDWDNGTVTKESTCTETGRITYQCRRCGYTRTDATPRLGHHWSAPSISTAPTCTRDGTLLETCGVCGAQRKTVLRATGHRWDDGTISPAPTCTEDGALIKTCQVCGAQDSETLPATGHQWDDGTVTVSPGYIREGVRTYTCQTCGQTKQDILPATGENPFGDISAEDYYYIPVLWALDQEITTGLNTGRFGPERPCSREQVVTFLWRAAGCPSPSNTATDFTDLDSSKYYYTAVLWAVEQGITNGLSSTRFGPNRTCTRAQVAAFLWRAVGCPTASHPSAFTDIGGAGYAKDAIAWAAEKGITTGSSATRFSPSRTCTRGQIATFLYRAYS